jgi:hypothetical protein
MSNREISELQRIFLTRLATLDHILDVGQKHLPDFDATLQERLAPDMFTLGGQIALACNQPRGFAQWCAGHSIENLKPDIATLPQARDAIQQAKSMVSAIGVDDAKLDETKRIGLGGDRYCEFPARQYVSEYLLPNLYFHITTAYAILRKLGVPVGKADFMAFLAPHVRQDQAA